MIEEYTARFLNLLGPTLGRVPPSVYVGTLVGLVNSCLFYLRFGRGLKLFLPYLILGSAAALLGFAVGKQVGGPGPVVGEVNVAVASLSTWIILFVARSLRL